VLESYEEHHVADVLCMELAGMPQCRGLKGEVMRDLTVF
jgi:hypothetical protein